MAQGVDMIVLDEHEHEDLFAEVALHRRILAAQHFHLHLVRDGLTLSHLDTDPA